MYKEAKKIMKQQPKNRKLLASAGSVLDSTIRVVRCLCLDDPMAKQTSIRGRSIEMDAEAMYGEAEQEFKMMRKLAVLKKY